MLKGKFAYFQLEYKPYTLKTMKEFFKDPTPKRLFGEGQILEFYAKN